MDAIVQKPFDTLAEMRANYGQLSDQIGKDILSPANTEQVRVFILRGAATGAVLDAPKDRATAQGLINFWVARLTAASRTKDGAQPVPSEIVPPFERTLLADFDGATVKQVAADAEAWFAALPPDRQANARRALMRMVVLPADGKAFAPSPVARAALDSFGPPERIEAGLATLQEKRILRLTLGETPGAGLVGLRYEALMREWPRMAGWLDKRLRFRQASRYWEANGQAPSALIRDDLLDEAREYHDLDRLEQQFIAASAKRAREQDRQERHLHRWFVGLSAVATLAAVAAVVLLWVWYRSEEAKSEAVNAQKEIVTMQKDGLIAVGLVDSISMAVLIKLVTKDGAHYAKKLLIVQILGRMVSAPSEEAWREAQANWGALEADLREDPENDHWFENTFFKGQAKEDDETTNLTRIQLLTTSRTECQLHREELYWVTNYLAKYLKERIPEGIKGRWYAVAQLTANELSKAARRGRTLDEVAIFHGLFWRLYLGEMVLVESPNVAAAMIQFGERLKEWEKEGAGVKAPPDLANRMEAAAHELKAACDADK